MVMSKKILVSPHNDDETLFAAFTLLREGPLVVVVFDSYAQPARGIEGSDSLVRRQESVEACCILGCQVEFLGFSDAAPPTAEQIRATLRLRYAAAKQIWAPAWEHGGHPQHNLVAEACAGLPVVDSYLTYHVMGKSVSNRKVPVERARWVSKKLRALACYESQFDSRCGCLPHFISRGLEEYYLGSAAPEANWVGQSNRLEVL